MDRIFSKSNQPALLALVVGALVGISPFLVALTPETAFIAHLLGAMTVAFAIKRMQRPGRLDWAVFIILGGIVAIAPFVPLELPAAGFEWVKVAAGVLIAAAGVWHYVSGSAGEATGKGATTHDRTAQQS